MSLVANVRDPLQMKDIFKQLKELADVVTLLCTEDGISIQCLDTSHVFYIQLSLFNSGEAFSVYRISESPVTVTLSVRSFFMLALKEVQTGDSLVIEVDEEDTDFFSCTLTRGSKCTLRRKTRIPQLMVLEDAHDLAPPDNNYDICRTVLPCGALAQLAKMLKGTGESMTLEGIHVEQALKFTAIDTNSQTSITMNSQVGQQDIAISVREDVSVRVRLKLFANMLGFATVRGGGKAMLCFQPDQPIKLTVHWPNCGNAVIWLAPLVDEGEEEED